MTKAFKYLSCLLIGGAMAAGAVSCTDEKYEMPSPNITPDQLVEGVAYTVEHDAQNPNIIHLTSLMPAEYQVAWVTPQGRKTGATASLSIPFDGTYEVQMGVDTRGGYVWSEPYTFTIDEFCADFVEHYLWKRISGGVGCSKTWQLDLGVLADGSWKATFFGGPHWFFTNTYNWDCLHAANESETVNNNFLDNEDWEASMAITPNSDWSWFADYASNDWLVEGGAQNFGYITFDLINGANVTITDADGNVLSKGTYMLDTDAHTVQLSDTYPLEATDTRTHERFLQLLYLSDDAMLLMAPTEGVTLNYVTKEYFETYTPPVATTITLPEGWYDAFNTQIKYCSWTLDEMAPFDWYDLGGEALNGFKTPGEYPAAFTPVSSTIESFKMNLCNPAIGKYTAGDAAGEVTINENGTMNLSAGIGDMLLGGSTVKLEGQEFSFISFEYDNNGLVESFVLGLPQYDVNGTLYQYLGYKFVADYGVAKLPKFRCALQYFNSGFVFDVGEVYIDSDGQYSVTVNVTDPAIYGLYFDVEKVTLTHPNFDITINDIKKDGTSTGLTDADIERTVGDKDGDARRYILNPWNEATAPVITPTLTGASTITVDFTIRLDSGTPWGN